MKFIQYKFLNTLLHVLVWSVVLLFPYLVSEEVNQIKLGPLPGIFFTISGIIHITIFYLNASYLYPKMLNRSYWWFYIFAIILLIFLSVKVKFFILELWFPDVSAEARNHVLFPSVLVYIVSTIYCITIEKINAEKTAKENAAMLLGMELKFLRSQINPHFLFNILTSFVSLARKKSDHLETSILMLSSLMRYMLYDINKKISLHQEIEYMESYIALQKLRFGQNIDITYTFALSQEENNSAIETMLLIPFVENAFKHGMAAIHEPFIHISFSVHKSILVFQVKNKYSIEARANNDHISGIGLSNVRSRLLLLYPGTHELVIAPEANLFNISLTLKLTG